MVWVTNIYRLMMILLSSVFDANIRNRGDEYSPWTFEWGGGIDGLRSIRQGKSWLTWFIRDEGPDLFWNQWWKLLRDAAQNYTRARATEAFKALSSELTDHRRSLAERLQNAVRAKALDFDASNPYIYFRNW
jgi:hypothetical protein